MSPLAVFAPGLSVLVGGDVEAVITAVCVEVGNRVTYKLLRWNGSERIVEWAEAFEVTARPDPAAHLTMGFRE